MLLLMLVLAFSWGVFTSAPAPWEAGLDATYVDGPRRDDGSIDYIEALNEEFEQEIDFEKNAASYYLDAWPTENENPFMVEELEFRFSWDRTRFPDKLRAPTGEWYDEQTTWLSDGTVIGADLQQTRQWVAQQQPIIDHILKGTRQEYCYIPIIPSEEEGPLIGALLSPIHHARSYARLFHTRAMLSILDGDLDAAHDDAMAIRRMSHHLSSNPLLITLFISYAMDGMAARIDERIFASPSITADQARRYLADTEALAPLPEVSKRVAHSERLASLDTAMHLSRGKADFQAIGMHVPPFVLKAVNWETVLIEINKQYDHIEKLLAIEDLDKRRAALERVEQSVEAFQRRAHTRIAGSIFSRRARSLLAKDVLTSLMLPSFSSMLQMERRHHMKVELTKLSGLLALYRAENGEYPSQLEQLAPKYVAQIPKDPTSRQSFVYRQVDDTFVLYGAGENGKDDGGPLHLRHLLEPATASEETTEAGPNASPPQHIDDIGVESPGWQRPVPSEAVEQTDQTDPTDPTDS